VIPFACDKRFQLQHLRRGWKGSNQAERGGNLGCRHHHNLGPLSVASVQPCKPVFMSSCLILLYVLEINVWQMVKDMLFSDIFQMSPLRIYKKKRKLKIKLSLLLIN
jgi:hypothetical protein